MGSIVLEEDFSKLLLVVMEESWVVVYFLEEMGASFIPIMDLFLSSWESKLSSIDTKWVVNLLEGFALENVSQKFSLIVGGMGDELLGHPLSGGVSTHFI